MAKTYYTVLTTYGAQLFAQAMANRQQVRITQFAVGDGNGRAVQPDSADLHPKSWTQQPTN